MQFEQAIFSHLIYNNNYNKVVFPFLKREYFQNDFAVLYDIFKDYVDRFHHFPSKESISVELDRLQNLNENQHEQLTEIVASLKTDDKTQTDWLVQTTEKFCQERAIFNALQKSVQIYKDGKGKLKREAIPSILQEALAVCFDTSIGHDYLEDWEKRFELYHTKENKVEFDLNFFNRITKGGVSKKTLTVILASTGVGKSLFMCHCAAHNLTMGKNVLYITLEMGEAGDPSISERIDANLLDVTIDSLLLMPKETFKKKMEALKERIPVGKLIVKEYPTAAASSATFRALLHELKLKKNFAPDIIYVDYLNICTSARLTKGASSSYEYVKSIAEELRGMAKEFNVPIVSATQTNRSGYNSADIELENTSESIGLPATVDFMFAISQNDELHSLGQILVKQLKNRYTDPNVNRKFVIGVDKPKMRLFDVEQIAQDEIQKQYDEDKPIMDQTVFGEQDLERSKPASKYRRKEILKGFK